MTWTPVAGMRKVAGAISVITTMDSDGERRGLTANTAAVARCRPPPSLLVCVNRKSWVAQFAPNAGVFAVNVLSPEQEAIATPLPARPNSPPANGSPSASGKRTAMARRWQRGAVARAGVYQAGAGRRSHDPRHPDRRSGSRTMLGDGHSLVYLDGSFSSVLRPLAAA